MVTFELGTVSTKVSGLHGRALKDIRAVLSGKPKGYQFMPAYKAGYWDGNICLMTDAMIFPTGLVYNAVEVLMDYGVEFNIIDNQPKVEYKLDLDLNTDLEFRDYQIEAATLSLEYMRGVLKLATNAGKTLVLSLIINSTGLNALCIVPGKLLMHQTAEYLSDVLSVDVGKIGDGLFEDDRSILVSTMQSSPKLIGRQFNALIIDECHHTKSTTIQEVSNTIEAPYRIGCSGTPLSYNRLNDLTLIGITGPVLIEVTNDDLIRRGYSAKPIIVFHTIDEPVLPKRHNYQKAYKLGIVENDTRNNIIANIAKSSSEGTTLILVERLEHVERLHKLLPTAHIAIGGRDNLSTLRDMRKGNVSTVITTAGVLGEGIDVGGINHVILASVGKSHIRLLQYIGRGLRKGSGKRGVTVHDFIDNCSKYLLNLSGERLTTYEKEKFEVILAEDLE